MATTIDTSDVKKALKDLEQGVRDVYTSGEYENYLKTMSRFSSYSFSNVLLIKCQRPDATAVAGYRAWQDKFHRQVNKGEKAIKIFAPCPYKKMTKEKDPKTGEEAEKEVTQVFFKLASVFDVAQTDGEPLPELVHDLTGDVQGFEKIKNALMKISPVPIAFENIESGAHGYFSPMQERIAIKNGMSEEQTIKTMIHEITHSMLHNLEMTKDKDISREQEELEAESTAFVVAQHLGISSDNYSFGYVAGWAADKDLKQLTASLDTIQKTACKIISAVDEELSIGKTREKAKDRIAEIKARHQQAVAPKEHKDKALVRAS